MGDQGLEHPPLAGSKTAIFENLRTESGTPKDEKPPQDSDLARLIDRWLGLSRETRQAILDLAPIGPPCKR
jgi:hypothetical protein